MTATTHTETDSWWENEQEVDPLSIRIPLFKVTGEENEGPIPAVDEPEEEVPYWFQRTERRLFAPPLPRALLEFEAPAGTSRVRILSPSPRTVRLHDPIRLGVAARRVICPGPERCWVCKALHNPAETAWFLPVLNRLTSRCEVWVVTDPEIMDRLGQLKTTRGSITDYDLIVDKRARGDRIGCVLTPAECDPAPTPAERDRALRRFRDALQEQAREHGANRILSDPMDGVDDSDYGWRDSHGARIWPPERED